MLRDWGERSARYSCFSSCLQATDADQRRENFTRSIVGAAMFDNARRDNTVQFEAPSADEGGHQRSVFHFRYAQVSSNHL